MRFEPSMNTNLVTAVFGARINRLNYDVSVEKVGRDHVGYEGGFLFLEYDGDNVVTDVSLSLKLK